MAFEKALVINDLHFPFENPRAIALTLQVAKDLEPDTIFLNGDIIDCWQISRYVKNPKHATKDGLAYEVDRARSFLTGLRLQFPKARIIYIFGNHEYRWAVYIANQARELYGLKGMTLEEQLDLPDLDILVVNSGNRENSYLWGKLLIGHFDRVNKHSGMTAKNLLEDKSISVIQAHTHRGGSSFKRLYDRDIVGYENFCLCNRNPEYVDRPNWQLGFSIVYKDVKSDYFYISPHPIAEIKSDTYTHYKTFFNGTLYQA